MMAQQYLPPQDYLLENFIYIPETGEFTNKKRRHKHKPATEYRSVRIWDTLYVAHRIIWLYMTGEVPNIIDHINGYKADNHWLNLQNIDIFEHGYKHGDQINKCKYPGIYENRNGWKAFVKVNYETFCIGTFDNLDEARQAQSNHPREVTPRIRTRSKIINIAPITMYIDSDVIEQESQRFV